MNDFIAEYYPQYMEKYASFLHNVQRWDAIRYLILDKIGGMYVDFDYESIEPMNKLIADKTCCFAVEHKKHKIYSGKKIAFNNAMMLSVPEHPFMRQIVEAVFEEKAPENLPSEKIQHVLMTTGPWRLIDLYCQLSQEEKDAIYLIPAKYVTPFNYEESRRFIQGEISEELGQCLESAYAVHFFFGDWMPGEDE